MSWFSSWEKKGEKGVKAGVKGIAKAGSDLAGAILGPLGMAGLFLGKGIGGKFKRGPKRPKDISGVRVDPRTGECMESEDGVGREPFVLVSRLQLAAGAQSATASLGDFFTTTACGQITANNTIPGDVQIEEAKVMIGVNSVANPTENVAALAGFYLIEKKNTREVARYSITDLGACVGYNGVVTSGATSMVTDIPSDGVEFEEHYDPTLAYGLELWNTRAFTSASVIDVTLILTGDRA
jgi:hypothetical protein